MNPGRVRLNASKQNKSVSQRRAVRAESAMLSILYYHGVLIWLFTCKQEMMIANAWKRRT